MKILPYGEDAVFLDLELDGSEEQMPRTHAVASALRKRYPGRDVVVGTGKVVIVGMVASPELEAFVKGCLEAPLKASDGARIHIVRAIYDGPDLNEVAGASGLSIADVVELHASREYLVEVVGFLPGFAYLGPVDPRLVLPRRSAPRPRVPPNAIGIAGAQTGIYPFACPGGWNLIARAVDFSAFDPSREPPIAFAPGDRVRFEPA